MRCVVLSHIHPLVAASDVPVPGVGLAGTIRHVGTFFLWKSKLYLMFSTRMVPVLGVVWHATIGGGYLSGKGGFLRSGLEARKREK